MQLLITKSKAFLPEIIPAGISRIAVRGFFASKFLSSHRLKAIAALRAKIIHKITINSNRHHGLSVEKSAFLNAKKNPIIAKGIAKMVWLNFTRDK